MVEFAKNAGGASGARSNLGEMRHLAAGAWWNSRKMRGVHRARGRILEKCGIPRQVRGGIFRKCEAQPWWPGLADKSFLLDHDDTRAALGLYQIPDLLAIVI